MKISILTPTYNRAEYLEKLYNSLVINTNCDVENGLLWMMAQQIILR